MSKTLLTNNKKCAFKERTIKNEKIISFVLTAVLLLSVCLIPAYASNFSTQTNAEIKGTCRNHDFSIFVGYHSDNNQHTYRCSSSGCSAYIVEECYNWDNCTNHQDVETLPCERCGHGTVYIHNYEPYHHLYNGDYYHILTCTNTDEYEEFMCGKTSGESVACSLTPTVIWRGFMPNKGHYLTRDCTVCGYHYTIGYFYPSNHPNYFDEENNCQYCQMAYPYYMAWDPDQ